MFWERMPSFSGKCKSFVSECINIEISISFQSIFPPLPCPFSVLPLSVLSSAQWLSEGILLFSYSLCSLLIRAMYYLQWLLPPASRVAWQVITYTIIPRKLMELNRPTPESLHLHYEGSHSFSVNISQHCKDFSWTFFYLIMVRIKYIICIIQVIKVIKIKYKVTS